MEILFIIFSIVVAVVFFAMARDLSRCNARLHNQTLMSQTFTNISHDLLTPLTILSAVTERLREQEPKFEPDYRLMETNIDRMVHLLQQILEISKSQAGELKLLVSQGDVMEYIQQAAMNMEPLIERKGLEFIFQCTPKSMIGWIDTDKIDKIIYNLLSNAAKYTKPEGKIVFQVFTNKTFDHIIIKISDNGIGIPKEKIKNLYQRFNEGDYRRMKTTGTGLGLSITRDLVRLCKGTINCESTEGLGTIFTIELPINKEAFSPDQIDERNRVEINKHHNAIIDFSQALAPNDKSRQKLEPINSKNAHTLLLVEDNQDLLKLMQQQLGRKYLILTAKNGIEALDIVSRDKVDLIISDVMMPKMDGNELTIRIKSNPSTKHLPVILISARTQEEDRHRSLQIGADEYITKPFKLNDLNVRIDNIIENRKRIQSEHLDLEGEKHIDISQTPDEEFLEQVNKFILTYISDDTFNRDVLARVMKTSESSLYKKLQSLTGKSVSVYIRDFRMQEARRIVESEPDIRVSDLAYRVGFNNPKYFATCFKKTFGVQPREYINSLNNITLSTSSNEHTQPKIGQ